MCTRRSKVVLNSHDFGMENGREYLVGDSPMWRAISQIRTDGELPSENLFSLVRIVLILLPVGEERRKDEIANHLRHAKLPEYARTRTLTAL